MSDDADWDQPKQAATSDADVESKKSDKEENTAGSDTPQEPVRKERVVPTIIEEEEEEEEEKKGEEDQRCQFSWGEFRSSFSTSFTGYSEIGHSISDGPLDGHVHMVPDNRNTVSHVHRLSGTITRARELPDGDRPWVISIELKGGTKAKKRETSQPFVGRGADSIGLHFDFGKVKKKWTIEIGAAAPEEDGKVAVATLKVKDIQVDSEAPFSLHLCDPKDLRTRRGRVTLAALHVLQ
jgi:hypothetical protein